MGPIVAAKDITPGMWLIPEGSKWPSEVARVTRSNLAHDLETGRARYTRRRFYFTTAAGATHGAEYNAETLVATY